MAYGWAEYAAIKRLMENFGLLNMPPEKYQELDKELLAILDL